MLGPAHHAEHDIPNIVPSVKAITGRTGGILVLTGVAGVASNKPVTRPKPQASSVLSTHSIAGVSGSSP